MSITLTLPFMPPALSPNSRKDRWEKAAHTAAYREHCRVVALNALRGYEELGYTFPLRRPVEAQITFVLTSKRRRDYVNLYAAFKAAEDGIVDAGLLEDDDCWGYMPTLAVDLGESQEVRLILTEAHE